MIPARGTTAPRARNFAHAASELEERHRQLFGCDAHHGRASRPDAIVRAVIRHRVAAPGWTKCGGIFAISPSSQRSERMYQAVLPRVAALARGAAAAMDLLQAVAERSVRYLSGPGRFHADDTHIADRDLGPRNCLRASGFTARNARGALFELAHQSPRQLGGQGARSNGCRPAWARAATRRVRWETAKWRCAVLRAACANSFRRAAWNMRRAPAGGPPSTDGKHRELSLPHAGRHHCRRRPQWAGLRRLSSRGRAQGHGTRTARRRRRRRRNRGIPSGLPQFRGGLHGVVAQSEGYPRSGLAAPWFAHRRAPIGEFSATG